MSVTLDPYQHPCGAPPEIWRMILHHYVGPAGPTLPCGDPFLVQPAGPLPTSRIATLLVVSRAWKEILEPMLYQRLVLLYPYQEESLSEVLERTIGSRGPLVKHLVRAVVVSPPDDERNEAGGHFDIESVVSSSQFLNNLKESFPALEVFEWHARSLLYSFDYRELCPVGNLKTFVTSAFWIELHPFIQFLLSCRSLEVLHTPLLGVLGASLDAAGNNVLPAEMNIDEATLPIHTWFTNASANCTPFLAAMARIQMPNLRTLKLIARTSSINSCLLSLKELFHTHGPRLLSLEVNADHPESYDGALFNFLTLCPMITDLVFDIPAESYHFGNFVNGRRPLPPCPSVRRLGLGNVYATPRFMKAIVERIRAVFPRLELIRLMDNELSDDDLDDLLNNEFFELVVHDGIRVEDAQGRMRLPDPDEEWEEEWEDRG